MRLDALVPEIVHLHQRPEHRAAMAQLIHNEFWLDRSGASAQAMQQRLAQASDSERIPLCLVALHQGHPVGVVNLVENDADERPEWTPWLAGMVVAQSWRGSGVGSALVLALLDHARRLGVQRLYFGTGGPAFYLRLGAVHHEQPEPGFWYMRFDLV